MTIDKRAHDGLTDEPVLTENARKVLEARYLKKDEHGNCLEAPADLFRRVARAIAKVEASYGGAEADCERWADRFYQQMCCGAFMPNSPTLMNAGREMGMLSACFVLPVRDSINDIFNSIKHTALIQKAGGGTGFAFDELRPTGDFIQSSGGTTSGPISFWRAFSEATNAIQQGAFRRGANMGMMYIHHPDILKFLHAKQDLNQFTNYNISVKVTDAWMDEFQADADSPHIVRNPRNGKVYVIPRDVKIWEYTVRDLIEVDCVEPVAPADRACYFATPRMTGPLPADLAGRVYSKRDIWTFIINNAWQTGEPGVVFIDRINEQNPTPDLGRIEATNPCGEQPLLPYEACNLGSLNLGLFVRNACRAGADVDWDALAESIRVAVRFLDNVIDANNYPLEEIEHVCKGNRKIGLGVMGFADALYRLNVPYNSAAGVAWGERFMQFLDDTAHRCSEELARERGCFPNWKGSVWDTRHSRLMRNAAVTTVAPTGTISIIANCSGGIEPMFSLAFLRNVLKGQKRGDAPLVEVNETFRQVAMARGFHSDELIERIAREGTLAHIPELPEDIKRIFVCAHDITPEWHMQMQAAFQKHCDASISKTINFPNSATRAEVEQIYSLAYELRCKGVTVYRDGCRAEQPMALKKGIEGSRDQGGESAREQGIEARGHAVDAAMAGGEGIAGSQEGGNGSPPPSTPANAASGAGIDNPNSEPVGSSSPASPAARANAPQSEVGNRKSQTENPYIEPMDLPEIVSGLRIRQMTPFGNMHVNITVDPRTARELEIFAQLGKGGDVANSDLEGICRVASLWLRAGGSIYPLVKQWEGIGSSLQIPTRTGRIMSLPDGLACAVRKYLRAKERFGLRAILLGEVDWAELDNPNPPPHLARASTMDRPLTPAERPSSSADRSRGDGPQADRPLTSAERPRPAAGRPARPPGRSAAPQPGLFPPVDPESIEPSAAERLRRRPRGPRAGAHRGNGHSVHTGARQREVVLADDEPQTVLAVEAEPLITEIGADPLVTESVEVETVVAESIVAEPFAADGAQRGVRPAQAETRVRHVHDAAPFYTVRCPECGTALMLQEGCRKCAGCGWAAC